MKSGLSVPMFLLGDDLIACLNKAMAFMSTVFSSLFPPTNNQLRSSSNPRNQATIQDGRITVQQVHGRQGQNVIGSGFQGNSSESRGNSTRQAKTMKCYNCQGMGHMAKRCTMPKRKRDATWFKEKVLLVESQAEGKMLDEEELAFLADPGIAESLADQTFTHNAIFQTDDSDAYDFDCDDIPSGAAVLMTNLSSCDPETVFEYSEQSQNVVYPDVELTSDSNVIPYSQYLQETPQTSVLNIDTYKQQDSLILSMFEQISSYATSWDSTNKENKLVNESLTVELDRYRERVKILQQRINVELSTREKFIDSQMDDMIRNRNTKFAAIEIEIDTLKQKLSKTVTEKESLLKTVNSCKTEFKQKEAKSIDTEIVLENKNKELENIICKLYHSSQGMHMISKPQAFYDNVHKQALGYQNPFYLKKGQRIKRVLYDGKVLLNTLDVVYVADDEETLILAEKSRLKMIEKQKDPKMEENKVNCNPINYTELNKLSEDFGKRFVPQQELSAEQKFWSQSSDKNSEEPSTSNSHVKINVPGELPKVSMVNKCLKKLRFHLAKFDTVFDKDLINEITEVQDAFTQMEAVVEQCSVDRKYCEIQQKQFLIDNDRLLDQIIAQDIVNCVLNNSVELCESVNVNDESVDTCDKCLKLEAEFLKKNDVFNELSKRFSILEQHCISLEVAMQLTRDTIITALKEKVRVLRDYHVNVKKDFDEIETANIELENSVTKLLSKNENLHKEIKHLKKIFKDQFDSIKKTCVSVKEHSDSMIDQIKSKSLENDDLKVQLQEKGFANAALNNELRKLKGKDVADTAISKPKATTIALGMFKIATKPLAPKLFKNKDAHIDYIQHSRKHANILQEIVEDARALSPLDCNLDSACKERLIAVTPMNKDNQVRPAEPVTSSKHSAKLVVVTPRNKDKQVCITQALESKDSNPPLLHSTGVIYSVSACESKPSGNAKKYKISQSSSSNKTNKVEDQPRDVKSKKNKKNHVSQIESHADVMKSVLNTNSKSLYAICNECLLGKKHDKCVIEYAHDVNVLSSSKYKRVKKKITPNTVMLPKENNVDSIVTPIPGIKVYSRRPKASNSVGSHSKSKIIASRISNQMKPTQTGESSVANVPSSSLVNCRSSKLSSDKFGNNQIEKIIGYDDYQIGNVTILRVYYVEGLGHNLFSVGQFCDSDLKVAFRKHTCFVRNLKASKTKSWLWHRRLSYLNFGAINHLAKQGLVRDLSYLHIFGALCYPKNESEDLGKMNARANVGIFVGYALAKKAYRIYNRRTRRIMVTIHVDFDELIAMALDQSSSGPVLLEMTTITHIAGLVPKPPSSAPFVPPTRNEWDTLLQPLFDEYSRNQPNVDALVSKVAAPVHVVSTSTPSLTFVDQEAPLLSTSQTSQESTSHVISQGIEKDDHDIEVAHMNDNSWNRNTILEPSSEESSSRNVHSINQ
ncbi:retrovirus-related pol polyprotein from transposon TNT 1-94 [Tanacetum coccineum]